VCGIATVIKNREIEREIVRLVNKEMNKSELKELQSVPVEFDIELGHFYRQKVISNGVSEMKKELLILKRKKAKELHDKGWSNRRIAGHLFASKDSVGKWVQMDEIEISTDNRGWKKGRTRVYTPETKRKIQTN